MNYYNENDPKAAAWLRELIKQKHIPEGHVDERSIVEVRPADLKGFIQCHFFAGIAGWSLALRIAGWSPSTPVWTASCPCQPFSVAGKGLGEKDERHLWPVFRELMRECKPATAFGEQVASKDGRAWLAGVFADLEGMGYQRAGADLCAAGVGAPHIRQRLYWVAHSMQPGRPEGRSITGGGQAARSSKPSGMGHTKRHQHERRGGFGNLGHQAGQEQDEAWERQWSGDADSSSGSDNRGMDNPHHQRPQGRKRGRDGAGEQSPWETGVVVECRDGKQRRIPAEPAFFPLADVIPARVVRLRGYGNAIVPTIAAEFIQAFCETQET